MGLEFMGSMPEGLADKLKEVLIQAESEREIAKTMAETIPADMVEQALLADKCHSFKVGDLIGQKPAVEQRYHYPVAGHPAKVMQVDIEPPEDIKHLPDKHESMLIAVMTAEGINYFTVSPMNFEPYPGV